MLVRPESVSEVEGAFHMITPPLMERTYQQVW